MLYTHCPRNNLNLCMKTKTATVGVNMVTYTRTYLAHTPNIYRCIHSTRFYAEILIIVWHSVQS